MTDRDRSADGLAVRPFRLSRRTLLQGTFAAGGLAAIAGTTPAVALVSGTGQDDGARMRPGSALALSRFLNRTKFGDLPPLAIEHAKIIIASTLASAASGSPIVSARIVRDLAKEQGGKPDATIWFDGAKLPVNEAARVNAMLSDAAASDDSDMRNMAHAGTTLASTGPGDRRAHRRLRPGFLCAIVAGYEAAGRIKAQARGGGAAASTRRRSSPSAAPWRREAPQADRRADGARDRHHRDHDGRHRDRDQQLGARVHGRERGVLRRNAALAAGRGYHGQRRHAGSAGWLLRSLRRRQGRDRAPDPRLRRVGHRQVPGDQARAGRPRVSCHGRSGVNAARAGERAAGRRRQDLVSVEARTDPGG